jgi:hypothetical protein
MPHAQVYYKENLHVDIQKWALESNVDRGHYQQEKNQEQRLWRRQEGNRHTAYLF